MTLKTSEVLNLAADMIEIRGWCGLGEGRTGGYPDPWGGGAGSNMPVCAEGAIAAVMGIVIPNSTGYDDAIRSMRGCPAYMAMQEYLGSKRELWMWNDTLTRSKSEVIEGLRAAAAVERLKEESNTTQEVYA